MVKINETSTPEKSSSDIKGELSYDDKVIEKITGIALEQTRGLLDIDGGFISNIKNKLVNTDNPTDGVSVEVGKEQVAVDLNIIVEYGADVLRVYDDIKSTISREINKITGLDVVEVNVRVVDIQKKEEFDKKSTSLQDKAQDVTSSVGKSASKGIDKAKDTMKPDKEPARVK